MARRRLKDALAEVAQLKQLEIARRGEYEIAGVQASLLNRNAVTLFTMPYPHFRPLQPGAPAQNITLLALIRADRYVRRNGIDWPNFNWEKLLTWLAENWDTILRVLMSLLLLI